MNNFLKNKIEEVPQTSSTPSKVMVAFNQAYNIGISSPQNYEEAKSIGIPSFTQSTFTQSSLDEPKAQLNLGSKENIFLSSKVNLSLPKIQKNQNLNFQINIFLIRMFIKNKHKKPNLAKQ